MTAYDELMLEAQQIITSAETKYERQRYLNGGDVTAAMEDEWLDAMKRAESRQAEAARELWKADVIAQQRDSAEYMEFTEQLRHGG